MTQYLILHKVRGDPQFDVAEKCKIGDEEGWVLCTCGHRAYPYSSWPLNGLLPHYTLPPDDWPDHYTPRPEAKIKLNILELVSGMLPKLRRRL